MTKDDPHYRRICWQCRRGMLEIDFFLLPYVEKRYLQLTADEQKSFDDLLESTEDDLFNWLMGNREPKAEFVTTIEDIRAFSKSQS